LCDGLGNVVKHVGPQGHAQAEPAGERVQARDVAGEMRDQSHPLDFFTAARALADME